MGKLLPPWVGPESIFVILAAFLYTKQLWGVLWAMGPNNQELLVLYRCRDMAVFVVHGSPRKSSGGPRGDPGGPWGVPRGPRGVPGGSQGRAWGSLEVPGDSRDSPGIPGILFTSMIL